MALFFRPELERADLSPPESALLVLVYLVVAFYLAGLFALAFLSADQYAQVVIAGRPGPEVLCTIANAGARLCDALAAATLQLACRLEAELKGRELDPPRWPSRLLQLEFGVWRLPRRATRRLKALVGTPSEGPARGQDTLLDVWWNHRDEIMDVYTWIQWLLTRRMSRIRRLSAMKEQAASELGISSRRLSDHVFQFSPSMFISGIQKYLDNWKELHDTLERARRGLTTSLVRPSTAERLRGLLHQNCRLERDCRQRAELLRQLVACRSGLGHMLKLASVHSTSGALQAYAAALQVMAAQSLELLTIWNGDPRSKLYRAVERRLNFLYRKQRAHPGFDLHYLLRQACERARQLYERRGTQGCEARSGEYRADEVTVNQQRIVLRRMEKTARSGGFSLLKDREITANPHVKATVADRLEGLARLSSSVTAAVAHSRTGVVDEGIDIIKSWCSPADSDAETCYLVTIGYSKTVRDLLSAYFRRRPVDAARPAPSPRLFLISDEPSEFDVRLMKWEFGEAERTYGRHVAAGPVALLLSLVREKDRVLVVLGAECYDESRRVLHPRGAEPLLRQLLQGLVLKKANSFVLVAAERYKQLPRPMSELVFSSAHFENVDLYEPELIDLIVTDEGCLPLDYAAVLDSRRATIERPRLHSRGLGTAA